MIYTRTHIKKKKDEQKIFETKVMEIAKRDGLVVDDERVDQNSFQKIN